MFVIIMECNNLNIFYISIQIAHVCKTSKLLIILELGVMHPLGQRQSWQQIETLYRMHPVIG